jgi:serine/threonine protein kinase/tetratricopeptide (TPR) repeat protein
MLPVVGKRFGRYELIEKLGAGGMGEVFRARDHDLLRDVAVKFLSEAFTTSRDRLSRFTQEARTASSLNHPNILTIHEIGQAEDRPFIVSEFVPGRTLRTILRAETRVPPRDALQIAVQIARGLAKAHAAGVVHRDLKPENVMVTPDGLVKILDFGLAKLRGQVPEGEPASEVSGFPTWPGDPVLHPTVTGAIVGTVGYMSPEQARGQAVDHSADQFALGAVLYEMAAGRKAFRRESRPETLTAIIREEPEPIARSNPSFPPPARWIVERCLQKEPSRRFTSTRDLARALEDVLSHLSEVSSEEEVVAHPPPSEETSRGSPEKKFFHQPDAPRDRGGLSAETPPPANPVNVRRSVAVLGFKNLSDDPAAAWLSTAFSQMLTTELAAGGALRTIPGENVGRMKLELSLSDAESLASDTLESVGRNLGTDMVVLGSYLRLHSGQLRLDLRVQDVAAGETLAALAESGTEVGLVDLVTRAGLRLRQSMGVGEPPPAEAAELTAGIPTTPEGRRLHAEGVAKLRELDALGARDLLVRAVGEDPDSPLIHAALAECWTALGHDENARDEARRAFELSQGLPREDGLSVEARYRETTSEWDRAVEIYKALRAFFPDSLEYGLRLAAAQSFAGKGKQALDTLAALRKLPKSSSEDPRIDLTEAAVARSLGDTRRELHAAERATAKGKARGARLLVARAQLGMAYALERHGELSKAKSAAEDAQEAYRAAGDQGGMGAALNRIGTLLLERGELRLARKTLEEALAIHREIGHLFGVAVTQGNLGIVMWLQGDLDGALRAHRGAGFQELGHRATMASNLDDIAVVQYAKGDLLAARETCDEALALFDQIGDRHSAAYVQIIVGRVHAAQGDLKAARAELEEAWLVLEEGGSRTYAAMALYGLGQVLAAQDDLAGARGRHEQALAIRSDLGDKIGVAESNAALASLSIEEGQPVEAMVPASAAAALFAEEEAMEKKAAAAAVLALALLAQRRTAEAWQAAAEATALAATGQNTHLRLAAALTIARVRAADGQTQEALASLETALAEAARLGLVGAQLEVRLALGEIELGAGEDRSGRSRLVALEQEARAQGFALVARKAAVAIAPKSF